MDSYSATVDLEKMKNVNKFLFVHLWRCHNSSDSFSPGYFVARPEATS